VVPAGTPGVGRDLNNNPIVTDAAALAKAPAARRALNEPKRLAGIRAAKAASDASKYEAPTAGPGRVELRQARRAGEIADVEEARSGFLSQPAAAQRATRQGIFIQQPAVERQRSPLGARLLSDYARGTKQMFSDNPRLAVEGQSGEVKMREGVLSGQNRESVGNKMADQMKYSSGYVAPSSMVNVYDRWRDTGGGTPSTFTPVSTSVTGARPPLRQDKNNGPAEDPRDAKATPLQKATWDYGGPGGGRTSGSSVMEGDQWGALRGAPVARPGEKTRKPGDKGYRGLEGMEPKTNEMPEMPSIESSVGSSIAAQYNTPAIGSPAPRMGVANPRTGLGIATGKRGRRQ
jgi:hypothetical protein